MSVRQPDFDVVVIGGGPAGLSAATELRRLGVKKVMVIDRESEAGGIPRHCFHPGFGLRDLHRSMSGPRYGEELVRRARRAGVELALSTTVTDVSEVGRVSVTSRSGITQFDARSILLATGARERPRSARLVPGDRAPGVFTTGQLQQWVYLKKLAVGATALIVGAEHVSFSAMLTLRHAGVTTVALTTELDRHQSVALAPLFARMVVGVPVWTNQRVVEISGRGRVSSVLLQDVRTGATRRVNVDTVVFTGDWIPDQELARRLTMDINAGTSGPSTDLGGRTSLAPFYAAGNLVHPVETADVAALRARDIARHLAHDLDRGGRSNETALNVVVEKPLTWVWPNRIDHSSRTVNLAMRIGDFDSRKGLVLRQGGLILGRAKVGVVKANRSMSVQFTLRSGIDQDGGSLTVALEG